MPTTVELREMAREIGLELADLEASSEASPIEIVLTLEEAAEIELALRRPDTARAMLRRALRMREEQLERDAGSLFETQLALAEAELDAGDAEAAITAAEAALALRAELSNELGAELARAHEIRGDALLVSDRPTAHREARDAYSIALELDRETGEPGDRARVLVGLMRVADLEDDAAALARHDVELRSLPSDEDVDEQRAAADELLEARG